MPDEFVGGKLTVTHEQAREIVRAHFEPGWTYGTFCLDDRRVGENDEFYVFSIGAREFIVDGDDSYAIAGSVPIVFKESGRLESRPSVMIATDPSIRSEPNPSQRSSSERCGGGWTYDAIDADAWRESGICGYARAFRAREAGLRESWTCGY